MDVHCRNALEETSKNNSRQKQFLCQFIMTYGDNKICNAKFTSEYQQEIAMVLNLNIHFHTCCCE